MHRRDRASGADRVREPQATRLFGYTSDDLIGTPVETLVPERYRNAHEGHRQDYFADPSFPRDGRRPRALGRRRDGSEFPAEIGLSSVETARVLLATAAVRDISERRHVEFVTPPKPRSASEAPSRARASIWQSSQLPAPTPDDSRDQRRALCGHWLRDRAALHMNRSRSSTGMTDRRPATGRPPVRGALKTFQHDAVSCMRVAIRSGSTQRHRSFATPAASLSIGSTRSETSPTASATRASYVSSPTTTR